MSAPELFLGVLSMHWIGEIVDFQDLNSISIEVYPEVTILENLTILQAEKDTHIALFGLLHMARTPVDQTRRAVAINLDETELSRQYPQQTLFIKQYLQCFLVGTLTTNHFMQAQNLPGVGVHTRIQRIESSRCRWLLSHEASLNTFLSCFTSDPRHFPLLKSLGKTLLESTQDPAHKSILFNALSKLLKDDYFVLKDILSFLQE